MREEDAHAWPELYLDGQGWTRWEPTPIRPLPSRRVQAERFLEPAAEVAPAAPVARAWNWWPALIGLVPLLLLGAVLWLRRQTTPWSAAGVHLDLYRLGRRAGVLPAAGDSVEEYAGRVAHAAPEARQPIERVARLLTARLYRQAPLTSTEERTLVSAWHAARSILRRKGAARS